MGSDPSTLLAGYLDFYREKSIEKVHALPAEVQRTSSLSSGWTPLELLNHLAHMERRWFVWGFLAELVDDPWGDEVDGRWVVPPGRDANDIVTLLRATGERTREVLAGHLLGEVAAIGGRFDEDPPTLAWICFHVLQEYARHVGHLDIAIELAGGPTGE
jgi:uncharacterized damage-inducible protein DinB